MSDVNYKPSAHGNGSMGLMSKIIPDSGGTRQKEDYVEIDSDAVDTTTAARTEVRIAKISDKQDVIDIKDAVYDGSVVIADITRHTTQDRTMEHITDELKQVANEVGGDIAQKGDDQLIITPHGVAINRDPLGQ
jgi:SepF-like predicted cell division protein (DUF552 family)